MKELFSGLSIKFLNIIFFILSYFLVLFLHELGHGLSYLLKNASFKIYIGNSTKEVFNDNNLIDTKYLAISKPYYAGGGCEYISHIPFNTYSKNYRTFSHLSGIIFQLIISLLLIIINYIFSINNICWLNFTKAFHIINIIYALTNLIPYESEDKQISDGLNALRAIKEKQ